jgi:hypothetical protein
MTSNTDTASQLLTLAGGPSILGVGALLAYARGVLKSNERVPVKGWLTMGAGIALTLWLLMFLGLAAPTVFGSWSAEGDPQASLILLSATWFAAIALLVSAVIKGPGVARYLSEAYRQGEGPWLVSVIRRMIDHP